MKGDDRLVLVELFGRELNDEFLTGGRRPEVGSTPAVLVSHKEPGHEERMRAHASMARDAMKRRGLWTDVQERLYRAEQAGHVELVRALLKSCRRKLDLSWADLERIE